VTYNPDNWVVVKIATPDGAFYKVLAGWSGGYLYGDSWKINSGIKRVVENDHSYEFHGLSGSCYVCRKGTYRLSMATGGIYEKIKDTVSMMPEDTDWTELELPL